MITIITLPEQYQERYHLSIIKETQIILSFDEKNNYQHNSMNLQQQEYLQISIIYATVITKML